MKIKFQSDEEFQRLIVSLAQDIVGANIHWRLYSDLTGKRKDFLTEYNQSPAFWTLTFQAHLDATIFRLIRIYDGNSSSLSLRNLLDTIAANLCIFDRERFLERLKDNPFVESLASDARKPDERQLRSDIEFSSNDNSLVKNLSVCRSNLYAHKNAENTVKGYNIATDFPLTEEEIDELLKKGIEILNRYSQLFRASMYSTQIVGYNDYELVLKSIKINLGQVEREIEKKSKHASRRNSKSPNRVIETFFPQYAPTRHASPPTPLDSNCDNVLDINRLHVQGAFTSKLCLCQVYTTTSTQAGFFAAHHRQPVTRNVRQQDKNGFQHLKMVP